MTCFHRAANVISATPPIGYLPAYWPAIPLAGHFYNEATMKTKLMIDMSLVDEQAVSYALEYLLETVAEMRAEDLTWQEALLALGQAAAVIADKVTSETVH